MKHPKVIADAIAEMKGSGWWCRSTPKSINAVVEKLKAAGVDDSLVAETISSMWAAAACEYGE